MTQAEQPSPMTGEQAAAMSDLSSQLHYAWYYYQATLMNADSQKTYDLELRSLIIRLNRQYAHWGGANLKSLPSLALAAIYENDRVIKILRRKLRPGQYLNEAQVRDNILVAHLIPIKDGSLPGQFEGASRIAQTPDDGGYVKLLPEAQVSSAWWKDADWWVKQALKPPMLRFAINAAVPPGKHAPDDDSQGGLESAAAPNPSTSGTGSESTPSGIYTARPTKALPLRRRETASNKTVLTKFVDNGGAANFLGGAGVQSTVTASVGLPPQSASSAAPSRPPSPQPLRPSESKKRGRDKATCPPSSQNGRPDGCKKPRMYLDRIKEEEPNTTDEAPQQGPIWGANRRALDITGPFAFLRETDSRTLGQTNDSVDRPFQNGETERGDAASKQQPAQTLSQFHTRPRTRLQLRKAATTTAGDMPEDWAKRRASAPPGLQPINPYEEDRKIAVDRRGSGVARDPQNAPQPEIGRQYEPAAVSGLTPPQRGAGEIAQRSVPGRADMTFEESPQPKQQSIQISTFGFKSHAICSCNFKLSSVPQMYKRPAGLQRINRRRLQDVLIRLQVLFSGQNRPLSCLQLYHDVQSLMEQLDGVAKAIAVEAKLRRTGSLDDQLYARERLMMNHPSLAEADVSWEKAADIIAGSTKEASGSASAAIRWAVDIAREVQRLKEFFHTQGGWQGLGYDGVEDCGEPSSGLDPDAGAGPALRTRL
ncbi:uncharacterized protein BXZ73DRAFT_85661 [Epithele typhae]|uniref:uncharacterized protein n=1 Tax=Epithele typhae TaxID=378194 RepID=UPI002007C7A9|nr:uncharacterized protein BXZ73DRAFT_85661 [Epithele typhae]KAH9900658.1 hypothetical protein BXZ73DRAFT_85661 [Epithele typhae]